MGVGGKRFRHQSVSLTLVADLWMSRVVSLVRIFNLVVAQKGSGVGAFLVGSWGLNVLVEYAQQPERHAAG